jgi:uncharacterized protein YjgD (DUF1641 family)
MDNDLALLHQKIDTLTATVEAQRLRLDTLNASSDGVSGLHTKLDEILEHVTIQHQRQQEWQELQNDVMPIANQLVKLTIDELAEIGTEFQLEDLLFLVKRVLRDTQLLTELVGRLEATVELADDIQTIGNQAFHQATVALDHMERQGYFTFARGGWRLVEKIVTEFGEEDVNALGDNIVLILNTIKEMTQPEIMSFVHNTLLVAEGEIDKPVDISYTGILRQMRDPAVRRGLALTMRVLHVVGSQAAGDGKAEEIDIAATA